MTEKRNNDKATCFRAFKNSTLKYEDIRPIFEELGWTPPRIRDNLGIGDDMSRRVMKKSFFQYAKMVPTGYDGLIMNLFYKAWTAYSKHPEVVLHVIERYRGHPTDFLCVLSAIAMPGKLFRAATNLRAMRDDVLDPDAAAPTVADLFGGN